MWTIEKEKLNENLSREIELFTLGIGNYSEEDIKNGAKGLAGPVLVKTTRFIVNFEEQDSFTYLAKREIQTERNGGYYFEPIFRIFDYSKNFAMVYLRSSKRRFGALLWGLF
jgi:hypothetical protein